MLISIADIRVGDAVYDQGSNKWVKVSQKTYGAGCVSVTFEDMPDHQFKVPPDIRIAVQREEGNPVDRVREIAEALSVATGFPLDERTFMEAVTDCEGVVTAEAYEKLLEDELRIEGENRDWSEGS